MTECLNGQGPLTLRQMIEVESWLSKMEALIECLQDSDQEPINGFLSANLERYAQNLPMLQRRLLQEALTLSRQIRSSPLNPPQKGAKDTSTSSVSSQRLYPCLDGTCPQCNTASFFSPGSTSRDIERTTQESL